MVAAFEAAWYKVKDCTKEPFVGINVTSDTEGNYYLDHKDKIEGLVKAARVTGAKVQKQPYPLDGPFLSNIDNAKDAAEAAECASRVQYRQLIGMLSYIRPCVSHDVAEHADYLSVLYS